MIINAHATFAETPDDICVKISDEFEIPELSVAIDRLAANERLRGLGAKCKVYQKFLAAGLRLSLQRVDRGFTQKLRRFF